MLETPFFLPLAQMTVPAAPATTSAPATAPATPPSTMRIETTAPAATGPAGTATATAAAGAASHFPAPDNLTATANSTSEIALTWKDTATGETGYHVYRSADGTKYELVKELPKDATAYTDSGLATGTAYAYKVVAYDAAGDGTPAETKGATSAGFLGGLPNILMFGAIIVLLYFFLIRGQRKEKKKRESMMKELKKGDKVMTIGGMVARVVSVDGDDVVLKIDESNNTKATYRKSAIQEVIDRDDKKS